MCKRLLAPLKMYPLFFFYYHIQINPKNPGVLHQSRDNGSFYKYWRVYNTIITRETELEHKDTTVKYSRIQPAKCHIIVNATTRTNCMPMTAHIYFAAPQ